jgi:chromatin segregation and condensation protein Rec8/ScpA/Scc1 (kleisin family)
LVNEIDAKGDIVKPVRLTEANPIAEEKKDQDDEIKISEENAKILKSVISEQEFENFEKFLEEINLYYFAIFFIQALNQLKLLAS